MGYISIIYGLIEGPNWRRPDYWQMGHQNLYAISMLPEEDEWPFLSRGLFSFVRHAAQGNYKRQMIHFGGSFKQLDEEWEEWLAKFEALLQRMYWHRVHLHLRSERYGAHDYLWIAHGGWYSPSSGEDWTHLGGPRQFSSEDWPLSDGPRDVS